MARKVIVGTLVLTTLLPSLALADLGDSREISTLKYIRLSHDNNFDVVGKDGLLHSLDSIWSYYWDNAGHAIGHVYNAEGIAIAVSYKARRLELSTGDVTKFLKLNKLPDLNDSYWIHTERLPWSNTLMWISRDSKYYVELDYGDVEALKRLYAVFIQTAQAHKAIQDFEKADI